METRFLGRSVVKLKLLYAILENSQLEASGENTLAIYRD